MSGAWLTWCRKNSEGPIGHLTDCKGDLEQFVRYFSSRGLISVFGNEDRDRGEGEASWTPRREADAR
ncbi:MAG: hypothetical protein CL908_24235 [Deltaproteobacteria bacterium]|nr:hypothetical protein [Deltaproteobacteria bacterium]